MRQLTRVICCTATVLAMTSCGSQSASTGPGSSTGSGSTTTPTSQSQQSVFPLTITRTGGVAGFHDVVVVASDGLVTLTDKTKKLRQCRLTTAEVTRLTAAASKVPWPRITPGNPSPSFPDDLVTMVLSPAGGPVRLEDPQIGSSGQVMQTLVDNLLSGTAASGMCPPA